MTLERTFVIGDIGGHVNALWEALKFAGLDPDTLVLPPHVTVVSLGDLMDRGPHSLECLILARKVMAANPKSYIQLIGNHEANWLQDYVAFVSNSDSPAIDYLREWARDGTLYLAAYVESPRPTLLTHAGLTSGLWNDLGRPTSTKEAARRINDGWYSPYHVLVTRSGMMLGDPPTTSAGVYWADAGHELALGWLDIPTPFDQVHGHASSFDWTKQVWTAPRDVVERGYLNKERRHVRIDLGDHSLIGIDPGLGADGDAPFRPYILAGTAHVVGAPIVDLAQERLRSVFAALDDPTPKALEE
jgi:hypothetical protein